MLIKKQILSINDNERNNHTYIKINNLFTPNEFEKLLSFIEHNKIMTEGKIDQNKTDTNQRSCKTFPLIANHKTMWFYDKLAEILLQINKIWKFNITHIFIVCCC